jgi:hypothetical protein
MSEEEKLGEIERAQGEYEKLAAQVSSRYPHVPERRTTFGPSLKPLYTPLDVAGSDYLRDLGFPAGYPLTRGVSPLGYRTKEWTRRQVVGLGTAEETNERLRYLFQQGQTGFSVCGMGYAAYESSDDGHHTRLLLSGWRLQPLRRQIGLHLGKTRRGPESGILA